MLTLVVTVWGWTGRRNVCSRQAMTALSLLAIGGGRVVCKAFPRLYTENVLDKGVW